MKGYAKSHWIFLLSLSLYLVIVDVKDIEPFTTLSICSAMIKYSYREPNRVSILTDQSTARYATNSPLDSVTGEVVHVQSEDGLNHGCSPPVNIPQDGKWIALVQRGMCKFGDKIMTSAVLGNASAVIVYNNVDEEQLVTMELMINHVVSVFMHKSDGDRIAELADSGLVLNMTISVGEITEYEIIPAKSRYKPPPMLYFSVILVILLVGGLVVLMVCGIRRARFSQNKSGDRNVIFKLGGQSRNRNERLHESLLDTTEILDAPGATAKIV